MSQKNVVVIAAISMDGVYGIGNKMPWRCPKDMKRFKALTTGHTVVMGRKTWESLPKRPLPNRDNIVITSDTSFVAEGAVVVSSIEEAIKQAKAEKVFFIGGRNVWTAAMKLADEVYVTVIMREYQKKGDVLIAPEMALLERQREDLALANFDEDLDEDPDEHVSFHVHFEHWVRKNE